MSNPFIRDWEDYFVQAAGIIIGILTVALFIISNILLWPHFFLFIVLPFAAIAGISALYATFRMRRQSKIPKR